MAIHGIDHVSVLANDPEPMVQFYERQLGFALTLVREIPEMGMKIFDLRKGHDYVEVIQPLNRPNAPADGLKHVAFLSDAIDEDFASMKRSGAALLHEAVQHHEQTSFFFMRAPAGHLVEIVQYGAPTKA